MLEQSILQDQLQSLLQKEQAAVQLYAAHFAQANDPTVREQIDQLRRDKQRHILLIERLLEIIEA